MRCLPSKGGLCHRQLTVTPLFSAEYSLFRRFQPPTDSKDCFYNPYLTPLKLRPETSQNRRALLVRGDCIGGCDPDTLTCKPAGSPRRRFFCSNPCNSHTFRTCPQSPQISLDGSWGIRSRLHLRKRHTSDCGANCAIVVGIRCTHFNQGHTIPILIQRSFCSDSYLGFRHHFRISSISRR